MMLRPDGLYDLGAVIEYNTDPAIPGYGSAIFLHIWRAHGQKPTAGCVAIDRSHLEVLLRWLNAADHPMIILGPKDPD
jgi:L,D-peptidoglycan transpeptidase YkuD (ErfK/YbiS/YcfS/YnhG family)